MELEEAKTKSELEEFKARYPDIDRLKLEKILEYKKRSEYNENIDKEIDKEIENAIFYPRLLGVCLVLLALILWATSNN